MGKTQSKRSVDITTDPKKGAEDEVTGKMEKIEDLDQKEVVNGDATPQKKSDDEMKKETEESENDKDLTTEKSAGDATGSGGDGASVAVEQTNSPSAASEASAASPAVAESPKEDSAAKEGKEGGNNSTAEEISPLADESIKKSKKDKPKKKWSFRSISFGKKDKQKPTKTEEAADATAAAAAATNGETDKEEGSENVKKEEVACADDGAAASSSTEAKPSENGSATEKELNGEKSPAITPTEEKSNETVTNEVNKTNTTTNTTTTTIATATATTEKTSPAVSNETAVNETAQTEKTIAAAVNSAIEKTIEVTSTNTAAAATAAAADCMTEAAVVVVNGSGNVIADDATATVTVAAADDATKNGIIEETVSKVSEANINNAAAAAVTTVECNKIIPSVTNDAEIPHQNGTNADNNGTKQEVDDDDEQQQQQQQVEQQININKSQIEVNTIFDISTTIDSTINNTTTPTTTSTTTTAVEIAAHAAAAADAAADIAPQSLQTNTESTTESIIESIAQSTTTNTTIITSNAVVAPNFEQIEIQSGNVASTNNEQKKKDDDDEEEQKIIEMFVAAITEIPITTITTPTTTATAAAIDITTEAAATTVTAGDGVVVVGVGVGITNEITSAVENQEEIVSQPPPLPISPPPSQVSVFAFKDNTESSESTALPTETETKIIDTAIESKLIDAELVVEQNTKDTDVLKQANIEDNFDHIHADRPLTENVLITLSGIAVENLIDLQAHYLNAQQNDVDETTDVPNANSEVITKPAAIGVDDAEESSAAIGTESQTVLVTEIPVVETQTEIQTKTEPPLIVCIDTTAPEFPIDTATFDLEEAKQQAQAIVDEIAVKAMQIITREHKAFVDEDTIDETILTATTTTPEWPQPIPPTATEISNDNLATIIALGAEAKDDDEYGDGEGDEAMSKLVSSLVDELPIMPDNIKLIINDGNANTNENVKASVHFEIVTPPAAPLISTVIEEDAANSNLYTDICCTKDIIGNEAIDNKTDRLEEQLDNPNKDIATAKDLKEIAAAEITTQDLSVTCE